MTIAKVITGKDQDIVSCSPTTTVHEAGKLLAERRIGALPVMENGTVAGIFSERDLLYCVAKEGAAALERQVGSVMTAPPITVTLDTEAVEALSLMTRRRVRHLPVIEDGQMVFFLSIGDVVKYRVEIVESEARAMREYITTA